MKTSIVGLLFLLTVVFTVPASAKCCTVTNTSVGSFILKTKSGTQHNLNVMQCVKLDKSDFPINVGDGKCNSAGNYAVVSLEGDRCAPTVYNHLC